MKKPSAYSTIQCGDGSTCPSDSTCCKLPNGLFGCCPQLNAVCCDDHIHCCPNGYTCDVADGRCTKQGDSVSLSVKHPATKQPKPSLDLESTFCGDGSSCPFGETCCKMPDGRHGCCPQVNAVCCDDGVHCCPNDYTCDVTNGHCEKGNDIVSLLVKHPAMNQPKLDLESVNCGDGSSCPSGTTCCKMADGRYGCCPQPNAVCCDDHIHCCPNGYTCDVADGRCTKGNDVMSLLVKQPAMNQPKLDLESVNCGDGSSCPSGTTCCKMADGRYGCCPQPNAVCCDDHIHCCPNGFTCDVADGRCNKGNEVMSLLVKVPAY